MVLPDVEGPTMAVVVSTGPHDQRITARVFSATDVLCLDQINLRMLWSVHFISKLTRGQGFEERGVFLEGDFDPEFLFDFSSCTINLDMISNGTEKKFGFHLMTSKLV